MKPRRGKLIGKQHKSARRKAGVSTDALNIQTKNTGCSLCFLRIILLAVYDIAVKFIKENYRQPAAE